jgi:hypothetical protein
LTFSSVGVLGENVKYQGGTVHDFAVESTFKLTLLARGQLVIEKKNVYIQFIPVLFQFPDLSFADVARGLDPLQSLKGATYYFDTGCLGQGGQFLQRVFNRELYYAVHSVEAIQT